MNRILRHRGKMLTLFALLAAAVTYVIAPSKNRGRELGHGLIWEIALWAIAGIVMFLVLSHLGKEVITTRMRVALIFLLGGLMGLALSVVVHAIRFNGFTWWTTRGFLAWLPIMVVSAVAVILDSGSGKS